MALAVAAAGLLAHLVVLVVLGFAAAIFLLQFFRDPARTPEGNEDVIVSPADGTVLSADPAPEAPAGASRRISIFMSVFNCHVNRAPIGGRVTHYAYSPGAKLVAYDAKASLTNEQNRITLTGPRGAVTFKQIAGVLARRIVFYPRLGQDLARAERVGMIRFGSRVDLFVPDGADLLVRAGDKVKAGHTGVARWKD